MNKIVGRINLSGRELVLAYSGEDKQQSRPAIVFVGSSSAHFSSTAPTVEANALFERFNFIASDNQTGCHEHHILNHKLSIGG